MSVQMVAPGPKGQFPFGSLNQFNNDTLAFLLDIRRYGEVARFQFGPVTIHAVNDPAVAHEVLVTQANSYIKNKATKRIFAPVVGDGLFTSDGEFWKRQRRLMQPVFHSKRIGDYGQIMATYANELGDAWQDGETRHIDEDMTHLTMRIIARTLFDADVSSDAAEVSAVVTDALVLMGDGFKNVIPIPDWLPTNHNRRLRRAAARLNLLIQTIIDKRRASGEDRGDLLSLLLSARDDDNSGMTDKQVRDEALKLFGAGHETTSATMAWVWYLLAEHPEVAAKLHAELDRVLAGRLPTMDDLPQLTYTEMIIKETMRLYPAAWIISRNASEDVQLGKYTLQDGKAVLINVFGMHRDPRFFPDPDRFDPERFSPERESQIPKYAYIPFGGGPRVCIGNAFALMEARLLLATLAQRFSLSVAAGHQVVPERVFTLRPKYGMVMVVKAREANAVPEKLAVVV